MYKNRNLLYLAAVLATGIFLRVYKIASNYYFSGELGKELLYIRQFAQLHSLPLVGMATSHPWLSYGPFYYWVMMPIFLLFTGNPFILFWTALVVSVLGLILNYIVFRKIAGARVALFSTMLEALSPLLIWQTRLSKLHVFFWLLMPIFTYLLYLMWNGKKKWVFWAGLTFGLLFSFHFSQIPILGVVVILLWIKRNSYKLNDWLKFGLGVLIPNITLIWQDRNLALWLPYRVVNIADKNPGGTLSALNEYFGKTVFWDERLWIIGLVLFGVIFVDYISRNKSRLTMDFLPFYLISAITLMLAANILHGAPPIHYFLPIFTFVPVLFAVYLEKLKFWPFIVVPVLLVNLIAFKADPLFYGNVSKFNPVVDLIPYAKLNVAADFIVAHSHDKPMSVRRIGPYDYFPENYSQNYKYLVLWKGGNLVDGSTNTYVVNEDLVEGGVSVQK